MRLSRHAKNRLRLIRRLAPEVTDEGLVAAIGRNAREIEEVGGDRILRIQIEEYRLTVVLDGRDELVITVWREE